MFNHFVNSNIAMWLKCTALLQLVIFGVKLAGTVVDENNAAEK